MTKLRKTFVGIALEIKERRRLAQTLNQRRERRSFRFKLFLTMVVTLAVGGAACYAGKGLIGGGPRPERRMNAWKELTADSDAYRQAETLAREAVAVGRDAERLKAVWSPVAPPENLFYAEKTLALFKDGALTVQNVRQKPDGSRRVEVFCKVTGQGHRLKLSLQGDGAGFLLTNAEMTP